MRFPVVRVIDNNYKDSRPHIVGTNSHDLLTVDDESGGIQYHNLQCGEGTKIYPESYTGASYSFIGKEEEDELKCPYGIEIEFVTFEELAEIYIKQVEMACEQERKIHELTKKMQERREKAIKDNGLNMNDGIRHTGGGLI